jgi:hypothetical protein
MFFENASMPKDLEYIVDDAQFEKHHSQQQEGRGQKDIFFVWILLVLISVIGSHFLLNFSGGSPTGYVTATQDAGENMTIGLYAMFVVFIVVLIVGLIYVGATHKDY